MQWTQTHRCHICRIARIKKERARSLGGVLLHGKGNEDA